jgi:hypothetical protein
MGVAGGRAGAWALPAVVAATLLAVYARHLDVASWGLLLPAACPAASERAFGRRGHRIGAAAVLTERLLLAALAERHRRRPFRPPADRRRRASTSWATR